MIYDIALRLTYRYASPATGGRHVVRLMPVARPGLQRLIAGHVEIEPHPDGRTDRTDFFGNATTDFGFRGAHDGVALQLHARVDRQAPAPPGPATPLARLAAEIADVDSLGPQSPVHFTAPSPRAMVDAAMATYAREVTTPDMTAADVVTAVGEALHRDMTFSAEATDVGTPAADAFAERQGVCQDFSHIMIACLRSLGVPAAYVSGFLRTLPPPGRPRLEGADAMHAWVRAWTGKEGGWIDYDPTNALVPATDHVEVAVGRDYGDVAPIKGVLRVTGRQIGSHAVDMVPVD
ncbi:MAG: transglutaminase family protein [Limimaricola sp.]|uniref:transglutaminase family protein n=1 Tax=Limimaricola sp. TaxID=2211665 RepID=UPI001E0476EF|nr:transglutaminase family protein [Limimaricola sp.]MBI1416405.1 transglutaminase family protein [Limimaricola sp.]